MSQQVFYDAAKKLATQLKMLDVLIQAYKRDGRHAAEARVQVRRQHVESKLRHLNHHILRSEVA